MSIPLLTPVETPIFDDLVISELEEHFDDDVPCQAADGHTAEVRVLCRSCGAGCTVCRVHEEGLRRYVERRIEESVLGAVRCAQCKWPASSFDELAKVVPL